MWIWINIVLIMLSSLSLFVGIEYYINNRRKGHKMRLYLHFFGLFSFLWCACYGVIGILDRLDIAPFVRAIGLFALLGFLNTDLAFVSDMNGSQKHFKWISRIACLAISIADFVLFSNPKVDIFYRDGNWTTWHSADMPFIRTFHTATVVILLVTLAVHGYVWLKNSVAKRQKHFVNMYIVANVLMALLALPDTIIPLLGFPSVSTSGIGSFVCTVMIWLGVNHLNAFDIQIENLIDPLYQFIDAGVCVFDNNKKIVLSNPYSEQLISKEYAKTPGLLSMFDITEEENDIIFAEALVDRSTRQLKTREGENYYSMRITAAMDSYGEPYCFVCAMIDITSEVQALEKLKIANNAKAVFLASVSHEIRTPINAILGFDEMLIKSSKDVEVLHMADNIHRAGKTLLAIINDLLDMTQMDSGKMSISPAEYDLNQVIMDCYLLVAPKAADKNLVIELINDEFVPRKLYGDAARIKQIITNILNNAIKYTEQGMVSLRIEYREKGNKQIDLILAVSDTGIGIKEENMPYIFEAFNRLDSLNNRHIEGTGVGLSIVKNLLELMGGTVTVDSTYGVGSTFTVEIPQKVISYDPLGVLKEQEHKVKKDDGTDIVAPNARLLVVDDSDMNLMVFCGLLQDTQIKIDSVQDGYKGMELIKQNKYDIIFLDHMMPGLDGIKMLQLIKTDQTHPNQNTPVLVMTANAVVGAKEEYLKAGFDDYVCKPVDGVLLESIVEKYLPANMISREEKQQQESTYDDFPMIEGVDWGKAFSHLQDQKLLEQILKTFYTTAKDECAEAELRYRNYSANEDAEELNKYRIKVHAMKNSAALVGAEAVSLAARELEYAARDERWQDIVDNHNAFIESYMNLANRICKAIEGSEIDEMVANVVVVDKETMLTNILYLEEAMRDFDIDTLNTVMNQMKQQRYIKDISQELEMLESAVRDLDQVTFARAVARIREEI